MAFSHLSRRVLVVLGLGVAVPALLLAGLGIFLTLRISRSVEDENIRYNTYMAQQVVEAFEQELAAHLRSQIAPAENAAREGQGPARQLDALRGALGEFRAARLVAIDQMADYSLIVVESNPIFFAPERDSLWFAGMLLRRGDQVLGVGGWTFDPRWFVENHIETVMQDRLPSNPRLYGGFESLRRISAVFRDPQGREVGRVSETGVTRTERTEEMTGPFEGFTVTVAASANAPVVWTTRFVMIEIAFIALMALVIVLATVFGLRYTVRQLELAQIKAGFVSNVTHELKTPIALIRLAVETLEMGRVRTEAERDKFLGTISRETLRLSQLVDNILDFARLESGQRVFAFEAVDIGEIVRDTFDSFRLRFEDQGFHAELEMPDMLPPVRGDRVALSHCLLNLLDNAVKYSKERREVLVRVEPREREVAVSVTDRGIGIPQEHVKRIFEKFVRVETGLVHDVKGAGLGLSLVDLIIRAHGGRVEVSSTPGEGSTFTLVVPVAEGAREARPEPQRKTGS
jgi:signal transduction histidine kinase